MAARRRRRAGDGRAGWQDVVNPRTAPASAIDDRVAVAIAIARPR
jgi:hypothetical protein